MHRQPEEDLALIRRLMEESRQEATEKGKHLLIWGTISVVGLAFTYLALVGIVALDPARPWAVLLGLGWALSFAVGWRDGRRARVRTPGGRLLAGIWISAGTTLTLVGLAGLFGGVVSHQALPGLTSVVIAAPLMATAILVREWWFGWVAGGWWLGGGIMLFVPGLYSVLLMAAMALLLLALPGGVLFARSRTQATSDQRLADAG